MRKDVTYCWCLDELRSKEAMGTFKSWCDQFQGTVRSRNDDFIFFSASSYLCIAWISEMWKMPKRSINVKVLQKHIYMALGQLVELVWSFYHLCTFDPASANVFNILCCFFKARCPDLYWRPLNSSINTKGYLKSLIDHWNIDPIITPVCIVLQKMW